MAQSEPAVEPSSLATAPDQAFDGWTLRATEDAGFEIGHSHAPFIEMAYLFFGPDWAWAGPKITAREGAGPDQRFTVETKQLPIRADISVTRPDSQTLAFAYDVVVTEPVHGISGVGLELRLDGASHGWTQFQKPTLREDGRGVTLPLGGDAGAIAVELDAPLGRVYFERGNHERIRVVFLSGDVAPGRYPVQMKVKLPPKGKIVASTEERYGTQDKARWIRDALVWNDWPVDLRFLNASDGPVGSHGFLHAKGDDLVFEDGTPARFWGANVAAYTLFTGTQEEVCAQAERIAALGFNLVRIHHHDSHWQKVNTFDLRGGTTQKLDAAAIDRLDWWIKCLQDQGVYIWIDIHVGRKFLPGDKLPGFEELERGQQGQAKGFSYLNPRAQALMDAFTKAYLDHVNKYTRKRWLKDPGIVALLITNENDLPDHFGNLFAPDKNNPVHRNLFERAATAIAKERNLPLPAALRTWEPGPAKIMLADLQHRFDARALEQLDALGAKVPVATTSYWGRNALWSLPPLLAGGIIDAHTYGEAEALDQNPRYRSNWIHFVAGAQVLGKPYTVSEWNVGWPERDRFTAAPYIAAIGALQGWDALVLYCYSQVPVAPPRQVHEFTAWVDPSMLGLNPASAIMFRRGDVRQATQTVVLAPTAADVFEKRRNSESSVAIRTLAEQHRVVLQLPKVDALPWLPKPPPPPEGAEVTPDLDRDFLPADAREVTSDTREIRRNWVAGIQTIDTPRSQVVSGWLGGQPVRTRDVTFTIENPKASVAVVSLDGKPIASSAKLLVTVLGQSVYEEEARAWLSEPIAGRIAVRNANRLQLFPLSASARGVPSTPPQDPASPGAPGIQAFDLPATTHWLLLQAPDGG